VRSFALIAALCALGLAGCGGGGEMQANPQPVPPAATNRPPAPAIEGVTLDGKRLALADFRGRPVFVNVWSSW
jgi:hypothetical protein